MAITPLDTSEVRRSTRANRYMGFKAPSMADSKPRQSHVKKHKIPNVAPLPPSVLTAPSAMTANTSGNSGPVVPDATRIITIQLLGTNLCGIPPEELSVERLEARDDAGA